MSTPLYTALCALAQAEPLRLHMPGHKGVGSGAFSEIMKLDFTEIPPTGNLYTGDGPIAPAEDLCAGVFGASDALFFTCGSTQGIYTMLAAAVGLGGSMILDRGCHKSVYHGMGLLDITPYYLYPAILPETALPSPVSPHDLERSLADHPDVSAVFLTTPSYYGLCTDLRPLAEICHQNGVFLLVDQAHGAHFPFVGRPSAIQQGADLCVVSTHKTWPAMGSSSILLTHTGTPWTKLQLKKQSAVFATTSPSYPILASIDYAREQLAHQAGEDYRRCAAMTRDLRERINRETPFHALTESDGLTLDPCRLVIDTGSAGLPGTDAEKLLEAEQIFLEMADERYLVAILTCCDDSASFARLWGALVRLTAHASAATPSVPLPPPPQPVFKTSIRAALFGPKTELPLIASAGRVSAEILAPYPPGIPIVAPGEEITEKHIAYLQKKSYNIEEFIAVAQKPLDEIRRPLL